MSDERGVCSPPLFAAWGGCCVPEALLTGAHHRPDCSKRPRSSASKRGLPGSGEQCTYARALQPTTPRRNSSAARFCCFEKSSSVVSAHRRGAAAGGPCHPLEWRSQTGQAVREYLRTATRAYVGQPLAQWGALPIGSPAPAPFQDTVRGACPRCGASQHNRQLNI